MSQFQRKDQGGFQASERFTPGENAEIPEPDFSALEPESGFSAGELEQEPIEAVAAPEPVLPKSGSSPRPVELPRSAPAEVEPAEETPGKKRYYSPNEVMKKKGCIGCGGMALAVPVLLTAIGIAIAVL